MTPKETASAIAYSMPQLDAGTWEQVIDSIWGVACREERIALRYGIQLLMDACSETGHGDAQRVAYQRVLELLELLNDN